MAGPSHMSRCPPLSGGQYGKFSAIHFEPKFFQRFESPKVVFVEGSRPPPQPVINFWLRQTNQFIFIEKWVVWIANAVYHDFIYINLVWSSFGQCTNEPFLGRKFIDCYHKSTVVSLKRTFFCPRQPTYI